MLIVLSHYRAFERPGIKVQQLSIRVALGSGQDKVRFTVSDR